MGLQVLRKTKKGFEDGPILRFKPDIELFDVTDQDKTRKTVDIELIKNICNIGYAFFIHSHYYDVGNCTKYGLLALSIFTISILLLISLCQCLICP